MLLLGSFCSGSSDWLFYVWTEKHETNISVAVMDASFEPFDVSMVISLGRFIPGIPGKSLEFCNFFSRAVKTC